MDSVVSGRLGFLERLGFVGRFVKVPIDLSLIQGDINAVDVGLDTHRGDGAATWFVSRV